MISIAEVEKIHDILIEKFGGLKGIRDHGILDSAINRPYQTFDGKDLYPDPVDKAAAIFESIISNHPFVDGNKRTAYVLSLAGHSKGRPPLITSIPASKGLRAGVPVSAQ